MPLRSAGYQNQGAYCLGACNVLAGNCVLFGSVAYHTNIRSVMNSR